MGSPAKPHIIMIPFYKLYWIGLKRALWLVHFDFQLLLNKMGKGFGENRVIKYEIAYICVAGSLFALAIFQHNHTTSLKKHGPYGALVKLVDLIKTGVIVLFVSNNECCWCFFLVRVVLDFWLLITHTRRQEEKSVILTCTWWTNTDRHTYTCDTIT